MLDSIVCVDVSASQGRAEQLEKGYQVALPSLIITSGQSDNKEHDMYTRGPLRRPPGPSTEWIKEGSRMESSLGPGSG